MGQKYKFFIGENSIIVDNTHSVGALNVLDEKQLGRDAVLDHLTKKIQKQNLQENCFIVAENPDWYFRELIKSFLLIVAAGGYVLNAEKQLLMIFRRGHWDLPKGKLENGEMIEECAIREVEEECQVTDLEIVGDSYRTYHTYEYAQGVVIKESIWFKMLTTNIDAPVPQTAEDIEFAGWKSLPLDDELLGGAYASIRDVLNHFA